MFEAEQEHTLSVIVEQVMELLVLLNKNLVGNRFNRYAITALKELAIKIFQPVIDKIKEMMEGLWNYIKGGINALESLIEGKGGEFNLLDKIISLPMWGYLRYIPVVITGIYWAITAASGGLGALILNAITMVLPMAISMAMGGKGGALDIPVGGEDLLKIAWERGLGVDVNSKLTVTEKISIVSSLVGFTVSKIALEIISEMERGYTELKSEIYFLEEEIEEVLRAMRKHWKYDNTFLDLDRRYKNLVEEKKKLYRLSNEYEEIIGDKITAKFGFVISLMSLIFSLIPLFKDIKDLSIRATLLGLSVGIGVTGIITSVKGLFINNRAMAFLSGVGIASSLVGVGVSIYEITTND